MGISGLENRANGDELLGVRFLYFPHYGVRIGYWLAKPVCETGVPKGTCEFNSRLAPKNFLYEKTIRYALGA